MYRKFQFRFLFIVLLISLLGCGEKVLLETKVSSTTETPSLVISRQAYADKLQGFWLGQSLANWTGLVTEMDKIGGAGSTGIFYTRADWGAPDQPSIWGQGVPSQLSETISWVLRGPDDIWGSDDDTDIEYIYQHLLYVHETSKLTAQQIRDGWLKHIYSDDNTPFINKDGERENYLWVSNQRAHDLMREQGMLPPATSLPANNPHYDMIDAQLTTEIFGLFAPGRPDVALEMAWLPIHTTARGNAAWAAEFYVILHALAVQVDTAVEVKPQLFAIAELARQRLPEGSYTAAMYDFVKAQYDSGVPWEKVRDSLYEKYQVNQEDGYDLTARQLYCNGCFASGINFGASLISFFYGEGDYKETVKLAVLMGWDSDNPAATWGGLLGFIYGEQVMQQLFGQPLSTRFNIHRTRGGFPNDGIDNFQHMAQIGLSIVDRVVKEQGGERDERGNIWRMPVMNDVIAVAPPEVVQ